MEIKVPPSVVMACLNNKEYWHDYLPGEKLATAKIRNADGDTGDWSLTQGDGGNWYHFKAIEQDDDNSLKYTVNVVNGCPPVDFTFNVHYTLTASGENTIMRRHMTDLVVGGCSCLTGCVVPGELKKGLEYENKQFVALMPKQATSTE